MWRLVGWWLAFAHALGLYGAWSRLWRRIELSLYDWAPPDAAGPALASGRAALAASLWSPDSPWRLFDSISPVGRLAARIRNEPPPNPPIWISLVGLTLSLAACIVGVLLGWPLLWAPAALCGVLTALASLSRGWTDTDCDEFAVDTCESITLDREANGEERPDGERVGEVLLLQVLYVYRPRTPGSWLRRAADWFAGGRLGGHHVALFRWLPPREHGRRPADGEAVWRAGGCWWQAGNQGLHGPYASPAKAAASVVRRNGDGRCICAYTVNHRTLRRWRAVR